MGGCGGGKVEGGWLWWRGGRGWVAVGRGGRGWVAVVGGGGRGWVAVGRGGRGWVAVVEGR